MFSFLKHLFLPHPSNNHRARILHPKGITLLLSILSLAEVMLLFTARVRPDVLGFATDISTDQLLAETNNKRVENGLTPLNLNQELSQAAAGKANDMFGNNYWTHVSPTGKTPWDFIIGAGYQYVYAGENLAKDFQDSQGVVSAWMDSPSHKENILQPKYKDIGFAVVNGNLNGEETTLVVQLFGTRTQQPLVKNTEVLPTETPQPVAMAVTPTTIQTRPQQIIATPLAVKKSPIIDIFSFSKAISLILVVFLIGTLLVDAYVISRKRIIRISGNNFAHILLLTSLLATLFLIGRGSVI